VKILFLTYHGFEEASGISKKMLAQIKGLRENGHEVAVCHYSYATDGSLCRYVGPLNGHGGNKDIMIANYGHGKLAALRQRLSYGCIYDYCVSNGIELVYARSFMNASPPLVRLFRSLRKAGIKLVMEIPTYPYDGEFASLPLKHRVGLFIDKLFRRQLAAQFDAIVTFSGATSIFGQRTINISNGVDMEAIPVHSSQFTVHSSQLAVHSSQFTVHSSQLAGGKELHMIGVAEVHPWHGFDRVIKGLGEYYSSQFTVHSSQFTVHSSQSTVHSSQFTVHSSQLTSDRSQVKVYFHIVGHVAEAEMQGTRMAPGFRPLIEQYGIGDYVIFHGQLFGEQLDEVFSQCSFAIGSLGRHRSGITHIKTLKNREYACRGIPFIYSECDSDFDDQPYVLKAPADESPIAIDRIIDFVDHCKLQPSDIRKTVEHLTWKRQMQLVIERV
jgi:hypothetical protein